MEQENENPEINLASQSENVADKLNKEFKLNLPGQGLLTPIRLIAFFTLIGGLSIIGSLFTDIIRPTGEDIVFYFLRVTVGTIAIIVSYGIIERRRWAIWLYGLIGFMALLANPLLSIVPIFVVVYLYTKRSFFTPSILDFFLSEIVKYIKIQIRRLTGGNPPISDSI